MSNPFFFHSLRLQIADWPLAHMQGSDATVVLWLDPCVCSHWLSHFNKLDASPLWPSRFAL